MQLRDYQQRAVSMLYDWFGANQEGNPVLNLPGGSGKSVVIAKIVQDALHNWPSTRVLMLVHSRELVGQNAAKLRQMWPGAPMGIYSAGLGKRQLGEPITYASVQSVRNRAAQLGHIDLVLVDEAHCISTTETGGYRTLLAALTAINPALRIVGFTASPYRLGQGMITEGEHALFSDIIEPVTIAELVMRDHLAPLRSKITTHKLETSGLHTRQGDYIASEMEARFNTDEHNTAVAQEVIERASGRKHWLIFCSGVDHCIQFAEVLRSMGVSADWVTGDDTSASRDRKLAAFANGEIRAMCSVGVLTTGYDFPALDCIVFLRATKSPGLYLQMAVRGMRTHPDKDDCLILDFAGVVAMHGPVTAVQPPKRKGEPGGGEAPTKGCPDCGELIHASVMTCPACGHVFEQKEKPLVLRNDDIMGIEAQSMQVTQWNWRKHTSRSSGRDMLAVTYYGALSDIPVTEYLPVCHDGFAGQKAMRQLVTMERQSGAAIGGTIADDDFLDGAALALNQSRPPAQIEYRRDGKFFRVLTRRWENESQAGMLN